MTSPLLNVGEFLKKDLVQFRLSQAAVEVEYPTAPPPNWNTKSVFVGVTVGVCVGVWVEVLDGVTGGVGVCVGVRVGVVVGVGVTDNEEQLGFIVYKPVSPWLNE